MRAFADTRDPHRAGRAHDRPAESLLSRVVLSATIPPPRGALDGELFRVLSVDRILADSVHNVFCDESVSAIFEGENQLF